MNARTLLVTTVLLSAVLFGCSRGEEQEQGEPDIAATIQAVEVPAEHQAGMAAFNANCAACHGDRGLGTEQGPPLVNIIYEPSHHGDLAFVMAAQRGVRAHHWQFGDMPALPDVEHEEVLSIVAYIRFLQQQVGIL
jgi:mono/diheme cytochrome c family protein